MRKGILCIHGLLLISSMVIGGLSLWEVDWIPVGKNYPNPILIAALLLAAGQVIAIKTHWDQQS